VDVPMTGYEVTHGHTTKVVHGKQLEPVEKFYTVEEKEIEMCEETVHAVRCDNTPYQYTVKRPVCVTKTKCIPYTDYKEVDVSYEVTVPVETKKPVIKTRKDKQLKSRVVEVKETEKYILKPQFAGIDKVEVRTIAEGCNFGTVELGPSPLPMADHTHKHDASVTGLTPGTDPHKNHTKFFAESAGVIPGNPNAKAGCGCDGPKPCDLKREFKPTGTGTTGTTATGQQASQLAQAYTQAHYNAQFEQQPSTNGQQMYGGYGQDHGQATSYYGATYVGGHGANYGGPGDFGYGNAAYGGKMANTGGKIGMRVAPKPDTKMQMANVPKGYSAANAQYITTTERKRREEAFAFGDMSSSRGSANNRYVQSWRLNA